MGPISFFIIGVLVIFLAVTLYANSDLKNKVEFIRAELIKERAEHFEELRKRKELKKEHYALTTRFLQMRNAHELLYKREQRLSEMVKRLRKRQITFVRGITWFKNPETDIRVLKVQAREQLAIDLENGGAIEYLISENPRPDIDQTEITVKARIKTLNMK